LERLCAGETRQRRPPIHFEQYGSELARTEARVRLGGHGSAALLERCDEVEELEAQIPARTECLIVLVKCDGAIGNLLLFVDREQLGLCQVLDDVAHAENYDGVTDNQHALAAILPRNHLGGAAQAENDIAPALASRRPMIEFAEDTAELGLIGELLLDPYSGQPVEYSKLLLAKSLIDDERIRIFAHSRGLHDQTRGVPGSEVRRSKHDGGPRVSRQRPEPAAERHRLALTKLGERDIDIADVDIDLVLACLHSGVASDVARGFTVSHEVEQIGPDLIWLHARKQVKERTRSEVAFVRCQAVV